jgi:hypothetical protein
MIIKEAGSFLKVDESNELAVKASFILASTGLTVTNTKPFTEG